MKKSLFIISVAGMMSLAACKEKGPVIDFGTHAAVSDTVYIGTPETPQSHNILIEEFTGASCPNCPSAHTLLDNLSEQAQYKDRLIPMSLHIIGPAQTKPVKGSAYDFRSQVATNISNTIYPGISALPTAGIDRIPQSGSLLLDQSVWPAVIASRINLATPVNLTVSSTYDGTAAVATIKVHISYTQSVVDSQRLSLAIIEDNITDYQEYPDHVDSAYKFKGVFRDMVTDINGVTLVDSMAQKPAGLTIDRTYKYTFDLAKNPSWKPENCRVVAFVHKSGTSKDILQAATGNIKP